MKILISGGHLTPALSFIDFAQSNNEKNDEIVFVGRKFSQSKLEQRSVEREEITKRGIQFIEFDSGKLSASDPFSLVQQFLKLLTSFFQAKKIIVAQKPDLFLSFGGYLALPLALAAWWQGVPILTHEQTAAPGTANKFIAKFAQKVAVSFPETAKEFPAGKVVVTGNPIRSKIWSKKFEKPEWAEKPAQKPLLYITGGSQGSQAINNVVKALLPKLLEEWDIIHQCGRANTLLDYAADLEKAKKELPKELQAHYTIREQWITEDELGWVYSHAWAMISRAGANTLQEVIRAEVPTIFVPLAHAHHDEQVKNAQTLVQKGAAILVLQKDLDEAHLTEALNELKKNHQELKNHLTEISSRTPWNADQLLYNLVHTLAHA